MKLKRALARARDVLANNAIEDASLEGELLLRYALGVDRPWLYANLDDELGPEHEEVFSRLIERRLQGEPAAYITGHREFYGLDFRVDDSVLIPRPETELLVDEAISLAQVSAISTIADIGTGCGAIAISLALSLPEAKIYASDVSMQALDVARYNCQKNSVLDRVTLLYGDMLDSLPGEVDLIVANLPYVRHSDLSMVGLLNFEPALALDGGTDGLAMISRLCHQAEGRLRPRGHLLLEVGEGQAERVSAILHNVFSHAHIDIIKDLAGIERLVILSLTPDSF